MAQVHRLTQQAKANKLTFTNTRNADFGVHYAAIEYTEDDVELSHAYAKLAGVDGEDKDNVHNKEYVPEKATTRTQKTIKTIPATTTIKMMMEMTHQKQKYWIMTPVLANKLRKPKE